MPPFVADSLSTIVQPYLPIGATVHACRIHYSVAHHTHHPYNDGVSIESAVFQNTRSLCRGFVYNYCVRFLHATRCNNCRHSNTLECLQLLQRVTRMKPRPYQRTDRPTERTRNSTGKKRPFLSEATCTNETFQPLPAGVA